MSPRSAGASEDEGDDGEEDMKARDGSQEVGRQSYSFIQGPCEVEERNLFVGFGSSSFSPLPWFSDPVTFSNWR